VCEHLVRAGVSDEDLPVVAESLASEIGMLINGRAERTRMVFSGAVYDYLYPPSDFESVGEDSDD
jgi:hypothetical protein